MINIQILRVNKKGEILEGKNFLFVKFDSSKFNYLTTYIKERYKKLVPGFVFCLAVEEEDVIQVLRDLVNGRSYPLYRIRDDLYYFRSGNLVFSVNVEV